MDKQVQKIKLILLESGYRVTGARTAVIETLVNCEGHITADDLAAIVREHTPQVGRMTVYRTLDLLSELGVIRPIYQGTGAAHFILMVDGSHHHLICNRCHAVIEFDDCGADEMAALLAERFNFRVSSHLLELHGLCVNCQS